jgi:ribonuclease Z
MKVTFLGTAGSFISEDRTYPSILVNTDLLLDCGEGTTQKLIKLDVIDEINIICISHLHNDHFLGIFSLLWYYYINGRKHPLIIIGPPETKNTVETILNLINTPQDMRTFPIQYKNLENNGLRKFVHMDYQITTSKMKHLDPTFAFRITEGESILCYSGDTSPNNLLIKLAKNCDLFIGEATYPDSLKELADKHFHSTPFQMAKLAKKAQCKKLALVHISPVFHKKIKTFQAQAETIFPNVVLFPNDLDSVQF